jgi:hypothetical protein
MQRKKERIFTYCAFFGILAFMIEYPKVYFFFKRSKVLPEDKKRQYKRHAAQLCRVNPYPGGGCTNIIFEMKPDSGNVSKYCFSMAEFQAGDLHFGPGNNLFFC